MKYFCYLFIYVIFISLVSAGSKTKRPHHYEPEDEVPFFVNKIGPYSNPTETYEFYSLPFCRPQTIAVHHHSIGEDLTGDHKVSSLYDIRFKVPIYFSRLCTQPATVEGVKEFRDAIDKFYYFEMIYDGIPLRGFIGTIDTEYSNGQEIKHYYLFKHLHFHVLWNADTIVHANVTADPNKLQLLEEGQEYNIEFSYSATWEETTFTLKDRHKFQTEEDFFSKELEIHWLSIMNSCVLVLLLTGFLGIIILRILKSDYTRYSTADEEEEDYGWKLIHGDVFRFPPHKNLFTSLIGLGTQCFSIMFGILILALFNMFYPNNDGAMFTSAIVLYALTSVIGGYVAGTIFKQMGGEKWHWNIIMVLTLFTLPLTVVFSFVNTAAIFSGVTAAVPAKTIIIILCIFLFVNVPLTIIGGITGRRTAGPFSAPCRTKNFPREIPSIPWYRSLPAQMVMSGFLPFSAIYIELFYVYSSVWGRTTYQLYGILFIVAVILIIVTACITVALTYFQLSMEDHRWWWSSFLSGGSTGIFIYLYSLFYYAYRSRMSGFLQASFYFTYMGLICYFFFVTLGTVGWYSSLIFIRRIYSNLKFE